MSAPYFFAKAAVVAAACLVPSERYGFRSVTGRSRCLKLVKASAAKLTSESCGLDLALWPSLRSPGNIDSLLVLEQRGEEDEERGSEKIEGEDEEEEEEEEGRMEILGGRVSRW